MTKNTMLKVSFAFALVAALAFAGCAKKDSGSITIGGIYPLSGPVAVYGVEAKNGVEMAVEEINAAGGVNGRMLALVAEDDEGNAEKTVNAYKKLTTKDQAKLIIGSLTSGCTQAFTAPDSTPKGRSASRFLSRSARNASRETSVLFSPVHGA